MSSLDDAIDRLIPFYIGVLQELITFESIHGNEGAIQDFLAKHFNRLGLETHCFLSRKDEQSKNLVGLLKGQESVKFKSLVLNAHCDIAPVDDAERWSYPPFSATIVDGLLYGRGAQDDKAGLVVLLLVIDVIKNLKIELKGDLILQSVIEDETSGNGSLTLVENGFSGDGILVCDGTWPERIIHEHLGQVWLEVTCIGEPVAACVEARGINPIWLIYNFFTEWKNFITIIKAEEEARDGQSSIFMNVGSLHSGAWHGSVPSKAVAQLQVGFTRHHTPEYFLNNAKEVAQKISNRITVKLDSLQTPAWTTNPENPLIQSLRNIAQESAPVGQNVLVVPVTGHCDLRHFGTESACLYGPGGGKNAHAVDEYYILEHLPKVAKTILKFVLMWCNQGKGTLEDQKVKETRVP